MHDGFHAVPAGRHAAIDERHRVAATVSKFLGSLSTLAMPATMRLAGSSSLGTAASAVALSLATSGWYLRASLRNALRISSSLAVFETPSVS